MMSHRDNICSDNTTWGDEENAINKYGEGDTSGDDNDTWGDNYPCDHDEVYSCM